MAFSKEARRQKIKSRVRGKIRGTAERPRLSVFRSNKEMYAQLVNDDAGVTLAAASTKEKDFSRNGNKTEQSKAVGVAIAKKAAEKGIDTIVFDRNGFLYHGRIKAVAEGAREGGLKF
ncbi:MAG: 50S ribosomal protein L18 [Chitinophagales bacterium]|nr:50S ribosomal protein L18 [Chitinophagales bacterium]